MMQQEYRIPHKDLVAMVAQQAPELASQVKDEEMLKRLGESQPARGR